MDEPRQRHQVTHGPQQIHDALWTAANAIDYLADDRTATAAPL
ncbi:hypothetical protein AB0C98_29940 [Streptomyces sp. NPDC048558]